MSDAERRKLLFKIYASILGIGFLYFIFIKITGLSIPCFYKELYGTPCGGCGTTRMMLSLARLDFKSAIAYNPVVFGLLWMWLPVAVLSYIGKPKFVRSIPFLITLCVITTIALALFGTYRAIG